MNALAEVKPQPVERSEKDIITGLQETVSASRLSCFLQCRLKFFFRYVLKLKKPKTAALHVGSAVHTVLKAWNKARWLQKPLSLKEVHDTYMGAWADDSEGTVPWLGAEEEVEKTAGWRLIDTYLRHQSTLPDIQPEAVEVPIEADLVNHGLPRLIGVLDLVQQKKVIDYKTTSTTPNPERVSHTHEIQTSSYAVLYRHNTGDKEHGIELHHLVKLKNPRISIVEMPSMTDHQETRLYHLMEGYVEGLERRDFIPSPGMGCMSCEFFNECRRWH